MQGGGALSEVAAAIHEGLKRKTILKKAQLRLNCINALPDGELKTKLLMDFFSSQELDCGILSTDFNSSSLAESRVAREILVSDVE